MFVRYATDIPDDRSHQRLGVIQAASHCLERFPPAVQWHLEWLFDWFCDNLRVPHRFTGTRKRLAKKRAICWFRANAQFYVRRVREIARILETNGIATHLLKTRKPGYIVYEDRHQVAAIPFRDTIGD